MKRFFDTLPKTLQQWWRSSYPMAPLNTSSRNIEQDEIDAIVAVESSTDPQKLERWAKHKLFAIRGAVAANIYTSEETLDMLCLDATKWVRCVASENPNTSPATKMYVKMGGYGGMTLKEFKETVKL